MSGRQSGLVEPAPTHPSWATLQMLLVLVFLVPPVHGQSDPSLSSAGQPVLALQRLDGPITLDGVVDEPAWEAVAALPLTMSQPVFGGELSEHSEIRIAYDDAYVYASGRFHVSDPSDIRGNSLTRDRASDSDDYFGVIIDSFNDNEHALAFLTTPAGIRIDMSIFADAAFNGQRRPMNSSWNTFWDVATTATQEGWFTEVRIPFSSLRFQDQDGRVMMGLMTWRWIASRNELQTFPEAPPKWFMSRFKPSIMRDVSFDSVSSTKPVYVTGYGLGGFQQAAVLDDAGASYVHENDHAEDIGLDVKYSLTSNLTLDLTLNTDFAQVEADDQQVNLTRFSLFLPEKRLFFQERSSIFEFGTGGPTRLFYSRRIGLSEGTVVPIYGGARLVGRVGRWDVGFLDMQTAPTRFMADEEHRRVSSENFGVLRLRRRVLNEHSYAGGIVTSRVAADGFWNMAYGLDGVLRLFGDDYLTFNVAHTAGQAMEEEDEQPGEPAPFLDAGLVRMAWERRTNDGFGYAFSTKSSGATYDPAMGFNQRTDVTRLSGELSYGIIPDRDEQSSVRQHILTWDWSGYVRHEDGRMESGTVGPFYGRVARSGSFTFVNPTVQFEDLRDPFELSDDVEVPPGSYVFYDLSVGRRAPSQLFAVDFNANAGTFYDGWLVSFELSPTWTLSRHVELAGEYAFNRAWFPNRGQRFWGDVFRLRARMALDAHLSADTFVQYNSFSGALLTNVRFRYNFREGNDLYVVYNQGLNTDRHREAPFLPLNEGRTILIKYTHTLTL